MSIDPHTIAVLMSVYAPGRDIEITLASLRRQTVPFTLYLVDDGSPAKPDYRALLCGMRYELIELPRNLGVGPAVNAGLGRVLSGAAEYVARMDCGDIAHPGRLKAQVEFLLNNADIAIVGTWAQLVVEERGSSHILTPPTNPRQLHKALFRRMPFVNPSLMLRADVFRKIGPYSGDLAEDYEFLRRADSNGVRCANLDQVLMIKIENRGSISRRKRRQQLLSKLCIQWRYRDLRNADCLFGLLRSLVALFVPQALADRVKRNSMQRQS